MPRKQISSHRKNIQLLLFFLKRSLYLPPPRLIQVALCLSRLHRAEWMSHTGPPAIRCVWRCRGPLPNTWPLPDHTCKPFSGTCLRCHLRKEKSQKLLNQLAVLQTSRPYSQERLAASPDCLLAPLKLTSAGRPLRFKGPGRPDPEGPWEAKWGCAAQCLEGGKATKGVQGACAGAGREYAPLASCLGPSMAGGGGHSVVPVSARAPAETGACGQGLVEHSF